jgi:hypothetical protein
MPGAAASQNSGRAHQISRDSATAASAPPNCRPSLSSSRISRNKSICERPRSGPTRESCSGAKANPRFCNAGARARTILTQKAQSESKKSHPRACRPLLSVNSEVSEIMTLISKAQTFLTPQRSRKNQYPDLKYAEGAPPLICKGGSGSCLSYPAFFRPVPKSVMTLPLNLTTPLRAASGIRTTSSKSPVMALRKSSMLSSLSSV